MPVMDGFEATSLIRDKEAETDRKTTIIAMTAKAMKGDRERCLEAGMDDYIAKPVNREALYELLVKYLESNETIEAGKDNWHLDINYLQDISQGDVAVEQEMIALFKSEIEDHLANARKACEDNDPHKLEREAHNLKSISGNFGARQLQDLAHQLECLGHENNTEAAALPLHRFRIEYERVRFQLQEYMATEHGYEGDTQEDDHEDTFTVLICDDDRFNRLVIFQYLRSSKKFQILQASNGISAIEMIHKESVDLLLLDIMLPDISGYEVCKRIREDYPPHVLPVIMLTAKDQVPDLLKGYEVGANDYLIKPIRKELLISRIKIQAQLLAHRKLEETNELLSNRIEKSNQELDQTNDELMTLDKILDALNHHDVLQNALNNLVQQALVLFTQADRSLFLTYQSQQNFYRCAASAGQKGLDLSACAIDKRDLDLWLSEAAPLAADIYFSNHQATLSILENIGGNAVKSMLIMVLVVEGRQGGLLVLANSDNPTAFSRYRSEPGKLDRLKHHATSAAAKAYYIKELQTKSQEIVKAQKQLVRQNKLASLGTLTAGIAHELRNPLNFINNFASLNAEITHELRHELNALIKADDEDVLPLLDDLEQNTLLINKHGDTANRIIKSMMMLSSGGANVRQLEDLNAMVNEYVYLAYHGINPDQGTSVHIECHFDPSIGMIPLVPQNFSRVILNIVNNACYALAEKKRADETFAPRLHIQTKKTHEAILLQFEDNGPGIPAEVREHCFDPFFTTKPQGDGTGLGLSISYDIVVNEHHGELLLETEEHRFTRFIIKLPLVDPE